MKKNLLSFLAGALMMAMLLVPEGVLAESQATISVIFDQVKVVVNGQPVAAPTILYNGTTYVPLRAIGEMLGNEVTWDGNTSTAYINSSDGETKTEYINNSSDSETKTNRLGYGDAPKWDEESRQIYLRKLEDQAISDALSNTDIDIEAALKEQMRITGDWVTEDEIYEKKGIMCDSFINKNERSFMTEGFVSRILYTIKLPSNWDGSEITASNVRVKKLDGVMYYYVEDLIKAGVIDGR